MANLMLFVRGAFAEFERLLIRERQREGIALPSSAASTKDGKRLSYPDGRPSWFSAPAARFERCSDSCLSARKAQREGVSADNEDYPGPFHDAQFLIECDGSDGRREHRIDAHEYAKDVGGDAAQRYQVRNIGHDGRQESGDDGGKDRCGVGRLSDEDGEPDGEEQRG